MPEDEDYYVECENENCQWEGLLSETVNEGSCDGLCPKCGTATEPADRY